MPRTGSRAWSGRHILTALAAFLLPASARWPVRGQPLDLADVLAKAAALTERVMAEPAGQRVQATATFTDWRAVLRKMD
jgi:hypothetical protein